MSVARRLVCWLVGHEWHTRSDARGYWCTVCTRCGHVDAVFDLDDNNTIN
jgi:hypothetical protein